MWDLVVVGGGAAGLWAAGTAASRQKRVLVLEKNNKAGVKILMSGGTRCNITHHCNIQGIVDAFGKRGRFLKPALYELSPEKVVNEVNALGVPTKVEDSGKVFPVSDRALDVRDALADRLTKAGAQLRTGTAVLGIAKNDDRWSIQLDDRKIESSQLLICCGGLSYPECGTTGDGYSWAKQFGHTVTSTYPALTPLLSPAAWVHELKGITLPDASVQVVHAQKKVKDPRAFCRGGFLWTHFGFSGPAPMNVSRTISSLEEPHKSCLLIDLVPDSDEQRLTEQLQQLGRRTVQSYIADLLPKRLCQALLQRAAINESTTSAELPKKARQKLVEDLKRLQIPLSGTRGYPKAEVTAGGVCTKEVNPQTMESRIASGLFFAGEILDVDGPIGGYNFQAAFSTGHLAGLNI